MTPDGTLRTDIEPARAELEVTVPDRKGNGIGPQIAALPDATLPIVVPPPPAGERVEVNLDATQVIRLAVDLTGAHVEVVDGKIVVTLANGGVIVLQGDVVQQFLAGGDAAIDQFLTAAAGNPDGTDIGPADDTSGYGFHAGGPVPTFASLLNAAGVLSGTDLAYGAVGLGETPREPTAVTAIESVPPRNSPPVADADAALSVAEDSGNTALNIGAPTDIDGDPLAITVTGVPDGTIGTVYLADGTTPVTNGMTLTSAELTGLLFRPIADANGAAGSFSYSVDDGNGGTDSQTVTLNVTPVNDLPVADADKTVVVAEDFGNSGLGIAAPTDVDGDPLTITVTGVPDPAIGTVYLSDGTTVATNGMTLTSAELTGLVFRPVADANGAAGSFSYSVNDGNGGTDSQTVTLNVTPVNDAPVAGDDVYTTNEDAPLSIPAAAGLLLGDTDIDGDSLNVSGFTQPANGTVAVAPDGSFLYTPNGNFNGSDSFTYTVSDGNGGSATGTVTIAVAPANDVPVANDDSYNATEDVTLVVPAFLGVGANDSDLDGDTLTFTVNTPPTNGAVTLNPDGSFSYTPGPGYSGTDSFTYSASDGNGGTAAATVTINVIGTNDAPVATDDGFVVAEDGVLTIAAPGLLGNDSDPDGDGISVDNIIAPPANGVLTWNPDGSFSYTPNPNFNGTDSFTYETSDGRGGTDTATVTIGVTPVNDAPVAQNDAAATIEDTPALGNVLSNDTDVDGDALNAILVSGPAHGSLTLNPDGSFTYTPAANYNGPDSFTYKANDGQADSNIATVSIAVGAANDAPVAQNDAAAATEDTPASGNVLTNDTDVDGDALNAILVSGPAHGSLTLNADGSFTYTPAANYNGPDSFTYKANDGQADSNVATVSITVGAVNDAPVANADSIAATEDTPASGNVLTNDTDVDGDALSAVLVNGPAHGSLTLNADGSFTYTPSANYNGPDSFTYKANDGQADSNVATVSINVGAVNDAPVANADSIAATEDTPAVGNVLTNDTDVDGDALSAILVIRPRAWQPDAQSRRQLHLHAGRRTTTAPTASPTRPTTARPTATSPPSRSPSAPSTTPRWRRTTRRRPPRTPRPSATCWPTTPTSTAMPSMPSWSAVRPMAA